MRRGLALLLLLACVACGADDTPARSPRASGPPPAPQPTARPTEGVFTSPARVVGSARPREDPNVVPASGTTLRSTSGGRVTGECPAGGGDGFQREGCVSGSGAAVLWERRQAEGEVAGAFRVTVHERASGGWVPRLRWTSEPDTLSGVSALPADVPGGPFLVVGYRSLGSGSDLSYDVISQRATVVAHRGGLAQGSLKITDAGLVDYAATLGPGDAACCPEDFTRTVLAWSRGALRIGETSTVSPSDVPPSDL